jgi:antitoxin component YwqK of YwqJK toxin-antitoxin module
MKKYLHILFIIGLTSNGFSQNIDSLGSLDFSDLINSRNGSVYKSINEPAHRYCNGVRCNGEITDTFDNGKIKHKAFYINGSQHGEVTVFHSNGKVKSIGKCENGARIGTWQFFFETGNIEAEIIFDPRLREPKKWIDYYENGVIQSKFEFNDQGIPLYHFEFNEKGDTTFAYYPVDFDNLIFDFFEFHSNGHIKEKGRQKYKENDGWVKIGEWKWFDENGKLIKEIIYE